MTPPSPHEPSDGVALADSEPPNQDVFLGTQSRNLNVFCHETYDGSDCWRGHTSIGMATDEQKAPLVDEIAEAGSPLNPKYFIAVENLELWIENELAGLCRYRLATGDDPEYEIAPGEAFRLLLTLDAIFIRPQFHSQGFGQILSEELALLVTSGIFTKLRADISIHPEVDLALYCEFESAQGERFFNQLVDELQFRTEIISHLIKVPIKVSTDAGY